MQSQKAQWVRKYIDVIKGHKKKSQASSRKMPAFLRFEMSASVSVNGTMPFKINLLGCNPKKPSGREGTLTSSKPQERATAASSRMSAFQGTKKSAAVSIMALAASGRSGNENTPANHVGVFLVIVKGTWQ